MSDIGFHQVPLPDDDSGKLFLYDVLYPTAYLDLPFGRLTQVAEVSLVRSGIIAEHVQISHEITYVISGKAVVSSEKEEYMLEPGMIHFIKDGLRHELRACDDENFRFICIGYIPSRECDATRSYNEGLSNIPHTSVTDDGSIRRLTELLINEMYTCDAEQHTMLDLYIKQIMLSLYRLIRGKSSAKRVNKASSSFTLYHLLRYIDTEYMNITDVKAVSEAISYNEYYLSHLFKKKMGIGIKEYISKKKLSDAKDMLTSGTAPICEIAEKLGYSSAHSFSRSFVREYGMSPSDFRKANAKKAQDKN